MQASLCGHQLVFTAPSTPDHAPYVSTRHDVDAIVWLPSPETSSAQFSLNHVRTFNDLGYVQALKANRKFTTVSPDLTYSVITDCGRHVFVYCQPDTGGGNKARPDTGRGNKARELLHTLNDNTDILGVTAYNHGLLFILTSQTLLGLMLPL